MLLLNEKEIKSVVSMRDVIEADKKAFRMIANGDVVVPLRTGISAPAHDGMFLFMPSYAASEDVAAIKIIDPFLHNPEKGLDASPAQVLLIDGTNGMIVALMDGATVTKLRTGAASGAAFDILGKKECRIGGLIGTGGQAAAQLEAMLCARQLEEVRVFSRNREKREAFCAKMQEELSGYGAKIVPAETADEATVDADLLITVTVSAEPVFDGNMVKPGCTVLFIRKYTKSIKNLPGIGKE